MTMNLRVRQKQATRRMIAEAADHLFAEHGFGAVTMDEVAREAGVSRQTVFNHFPVKENLVFDRAYELEEQVVAAVRDRPTRMSAIDAFRAEHRSFWLRLEAVPDPLPEPRPAGGFFHLVAASPPLQAYGRVINGRIADRIADVLAGEQPGDPTSVMVAHALMAVYQATFDVIVRRVVAGEHPARIVAGVLADAERALDLLRDGAGSYPDPGGALRRGRARPGRTTPRRR